MGKMGAALMALLAGPAAAKLFGDDTQMRAQTALSYRLATKRHKKTSGKQTTHKRRPHKNMKQIGWCGLRSRSGWVFFRP